MFSVFSFYAEAQEVVDVDPELPGIQGAMVSVEIDGKAIFSVSGISSFPAEKRAAAISGRLENAAADPAVNPDSVRIMEGDDHYKIFAGDHFIMNVYDYDAQKEGITRKILAQFIGSKIEEAIASYREERSRGMLIRNSVRALVALAILTALLIFLLWLLRRINRVLEDRIRTRVDSLENISFNLIRSRHLWNAFHMLFRFLRIIVIVLFIAGFLQYVLGLFPWTSDFARKILDLFLDPLITLGKGLLGFLPDLAFLIIIYLVTRYLLKLIKLLFSGVHEGGIQIGGFDSEWAMPTFKILRLIVVVFALVIAFPYIPGSRFQRFQRYIRIFGDHVLPWVILIYLQYHSRVFNDLQGSI